MTSYARVTALSADDALELVNVPAALHLLERSPTEVDIGGPVQLHDWREAHRVPVPGGEFFPHHKRAMKQYRLAHAKWRAEYPDFPEPTKPEPPTWAPGKWCRPMNDGHWAMRCGRGLVNRVFRDLVNMEYLPGALEWPTASTLPPDLRDFQVDALQAIVQRRWCRIALATNAGKGAVIALAAKWAWKTSGVQSAVLCDEVSVWTALQGEFRRWAPDVPLALVGAGVKVPPAWSGISLVMLPTLSRRLASGDETWLEWWGQIGMVLADEADKATAASWRKVLGLAVGTIWRAGFSGTFPEDTYNDLILEEMLGPVAVREKNAALIERGISARPTVTLRRHDASGVLPMMAHRKFYRGMKGPELRQWIFEQAIVNNPVRHAFIASLISPDTPTAIVVNRVEHARQLAAAIPGAVAMDGSDNSGYRDEVLAGFRAGTIRVVVVTKILDRGTNQLGIASDLIFASGEGSNRQTLQRVGRGLRRTGGKEFLNIIDVIDTGHDYLHKAAEKRVTLYNEERFEVQIP